ncbi:hypothetical protein [Marinicrinis lubricantis]|uniref:ABC-2 family transporter protein n=1 Tax=Marinicrinis lubricantis TaxID=2086470 RepID=A0ABW1IKG7_9BACL
MSGNMDQELQGIEAELKSRLDRYLVRTPNREDTQRLIDSLQDEFDLLKAQQAEMEAPESPRPISIWKLCSLQLSSYSYSFWASALFLFIMITLMMKVNIMQGSFGDQDVYSLFVPLIFIISFLYGNRSWSKEMRLLEAVTPYPPIVTLLARITIVLGMCVVFGIVGTIYLAWSVEELNWMMFILGWLSQMLLISGMTTYSAFRLGAKWGLIPPAMLWVVLNFFHSWSSMQSWEGSGSGAVVDACSLLVGVLLFAAAYRRGFRPSLKQKGWRTP